MPFALVALGLLPVASGGLRLGEVFGGPQLMPANPRFEALPAPMIVHLVSVIPFALVGAFQFSSQVRGRWPAWHRWAGRVLVLLGMATAISGLWMTLGYPLQPGSGELLYIVRVLVGAGMAVSIARGLRAIRRGDVRHHLAWMTRSYALALGAGTQVITGAVRSALSGSGSLDFDLSMTAAWAMNLAVAEYVIRHGPGGGARGSRPVELRTEVGNPA
ncbi:DUF2306 domain-containing protein [Propionicimonas paludicola]|uniref:DUF2306 domain-containing protein n=1 Tax=Propionicimonas paludicola TaxID=185243 RepID=UPI00147565C7|nr:DUF2306 domain-containing protein [Propionicimonas paludicola]